MQKLGNLRSYSCKFWRNTITKPIYTKKATVNRKFPLLTLHSLYKASWLCLNIIKKTTLSVSSLAILPPFLAVHKSCNVTYFCLLDIFVVSWIFIFVFSFSFLTLIRQSDFYFLLIFIPNRNRSTVMMKT